MKGKLQIRMAILLLFLILAIGGKEVKCMKQGENTSRVLMNRQVSNTTLVEGGDVYDCIGVNVQPAFNHPLLKDHKIQTFIHTRTETNNLISSNYTIMEPSSVPLSMYKESPSKHAIPQAQLPIVECPTGTIPILRNKRRVHMVDKTIDEVISTNLQQEAAGIQYRDELYGTRARINVYEPVVKSNIKDISASSIQIHEGTEVGHRDGIGAGSWVYPICSGDNYARFHVYWVKDDATTCIDHDCSAFVQVSRSIGLGGRITPISLYNGQQYEIDVLIFKDPKTKNWWLAYGKQNTMIGYWPSSLFNSMKEKGEFAFWGGFVRGPTASTDSPQMGSGHFASEGFGKASFMKNIQIVDKNNKLVSPNVHRASPGGTDLSKYTIDDYEHNNDGLHMYYGGPGDFV